MSYERGSDKRMNERILLVLDLDETLVHARETALDYDPDFTVGSYFVYKRPGVDVFLLRCAELFDLAIWSAGNEPYVRAVIDQIMPHQITLQFLWAGQRCTVRRNFETGGYYPAKDLLKVKRLGRPLSRVLIVDDEPIKLRRNYGNAIYVHPFEGDIEDNELELLAKYLKILNNYEDMRSIEKRGWRDKARNTSG